MKILFVNGVAHGRIIDIPDDYTTFVIPVTQSTSIWHGSPELKTVVYDKKRLLLGYNRIEVMSPGYEPPKADDVLDALLAFANIKKD